MDYAIRITFRQDNVCATVTGRVCGYDLWSKETYTLPRGDDLAGLTLEAIVTPQGRVDFSTHYVGHGWLDVRLAETIARVLRALERAYVNDIDPLCSSYGDYLRSLCDTLGIRHVWVDWPVMYRDDYNRMTDPLSAAVHIDEVISDKVHDYDAYEWEVKPY